MPIEIRELIIRTHVEADRFDFKAEDGEDAVLVGLLLPAVQKVREAASRGDDDSVISDFAIPEDDGAVQIGLLLPAVQKVRESAASVFDDDMKADGNLMMAETCDSMF